MLENILFIYNHKFINFEVKDKSKKTFKKTKFHNPTLKLVLPVLINKTY